MNIINIEKAFEIAKKLAEIACKYEAVTGRESGAKGEIGEVFVSKKFKLDLLKNRINPGFDAKDKNGNKVQIKVVSVERWLRQQGRISKFSKHPFDYMVLGILDTKHNFKLVHAYKSPRSKLEKMVSKYPKRNPPIHKILNSKISRKIY